MAGNHLEQLVSEWLEYKGYLVKRNVKVGRRKKGGYDCELDIVAFHPETRHLVHYEPSMDGNSWETRELRYRKKFEAGRKHILGLFPGILRPEEMDKIEQIALFWFGRKKGHEMLASGRVMFVAELLKDIFAHLNNTSVARSAVPEHMGILRSFQFVSVHREAIMGVWSLRDKNAPMT